MRQSSVCYRPWNSCILFLSVKRIPASKNWHAFRHTDASLTYTTAHIREFSTTIAAPILTGFKFLPWNSIFGASVNRTRPSRAGINKGRWLFLVRNVGNGEKFSVMYLKFRIPTFPGRPCLSARKPLLERRRRSHQNMSTIAPKHVVKFPPQKREKFWKTPRLGTISRNRNEQ